MKTSTMKRTIQKTPQTIIDIPRIVWSIGDRLRNCHGPALEVIAMSFKEARTHLIAGFVPLYGLSG